MLRFDQVQRELKAIVDFDLLFSATSEHYPEEIAGAECRVLRKIELLDLVDHRATELNTSPSCD
jgi:hypothetical protein